MNTFRLLLLSSPGELLLRWTVLLAVAWMADAMMRLSHPRRRLRLWRGVLILGCVLPFGGNSPIKIFRIDSGAALVRGVTMDPVTPAVAGHQPATMIHATDGFRPNSSRTLRAAEGLLTLKPGETVAASMGLVWIVGAAVGAIRLLLALLQLSRVRRSTNEAHFELVALARRIQARLGATQTVAIRVSDDVASPFICGLLHPTIILPAELLRTLAPDQIPALLSHELAHLRSHDLAWCVGWRWIKTLLWFHPLLWKAPAAHNLACEQEADRIASEQWTDRSLYARWLAQLTLRVIELPPVETVWAMNGASQIVKRLALLRRDRFGGWKWRDSLTGSGLFFGLALVSAGWGFSTAHAEDPAHERSERLAEQRRPRAVVPFDPRQFDKYTGFYQLGPSLFFTITRKEDRFFSRLTGQQDIEFYPESPTKFFTTVVAAQISFVTDSAGNATELILHQNGLEQHAPKVDESAAKSGESALADRIKNNTADPEREVPLRRFIDALIKGEPNLDDMAPGLIAATTQQWPMIQKNFQGAGTLKSLTFQKVTPQGMDVYLGIFENRQMAFIIGPLTADHKMQGLLMPPHY